MREDYKVLKRIIYISILVMAVFLSIFSTSLYYKNYHVSSNDGFLLEKIYNDLDKNYYREIDKEELYLGAAKGMVDALGDPHSTFMTKEEKDEFKLMLENQFVGIGVQIEETISGVYITKVFDDSPAEEAGLAEGDMFSKVDGENVIGMTSSEIAGVVRGPEGSSVVIEIIRAGQEKEISFTIRRASIELVDLTYGMIGTDSNVGYIKINDFTSDIHSQFVSAYKDLSLKGMESLVIDVRDNGGGYLDQVIRIADMFVDDSKPIYQEKVKDEITDKIYGNSTKEDIEVSVVMNGNSASASELLAAALSEINGSNLIGTTTYGKGTAQTTKDYSNGSSLKYTFAQWLTPDGNWINEVGVAPDVEIELDETSYLRKVLVGETLKYDDVNIQVEHGQKILDVLGYTTRTDSYFGKDTEEAIKAFQEVNDLTVTGQLDTQTANVLNSEYEKYLSDYKNDNQIMKAIEVLTNE